MKLDRNLVICAVGSVIAHIAIARGLETLPRHEDRIPPHKIDIRVIPAPEVPPPPEPEKPPEPPPPPPKQQVMDPPKTRPIHAPTVAPVAHDTPPPDHPALETSATDTQVYGVSMESTSSGGGPAMPIGNTTKAVPGPTTAPANVKPAAAPVAAFEATKMPLPQGRCFGKYTEEAKVAGIEGTVTLDLIVGEDGRAREIQVVSGLDHGLTEAALAALRDCHFSPGEKDGKPVAVKVRGFKISFHLAESE